MNGYEFEELVKKLLLKMGFIVEQTSLSGDGGVDLIALNKMPIFKGQYLFQCKHWSSPIGEPAVRDLYGVVTARNATKGILITNSTFTDKAIEFADNKNIELIDGKILNNLLDKYSFAESFPTIEMNTFIDIECFERDKYLYLLKKIEQDKSNKNAYEALLNFYFSYLKMSNIDLLKAGLSKEILTFLDDYKNRFCKRTKTLLNEKKAIQLIQAHVHILRFELIDAIEILKEIKLFNSNFSVNRYLPEYFEVGSEIDGSYVRRYAIKKPNKDFRGLILLNLHQIFSMLNFPKGRAFIETIIENHYVETIPAGFLHLMSAENAVFKKNVQLREKLINKLQENKAVGFFYPTNYASQPNYWKVQCESESSAKKILKQLIREDEFENQKNVIDLILEL